MEGDLFTQWADDLVLGVRTQTFESFPALDPVDGSIDLSGVLLKYRLPALSVMAEQRLGLPAKLDDALPRALACQVLGECPRAVMQLLRAYSGRT
jgi:hypothetical protein